MAATIKVPTVFTAEDKFSGVVRRMTSGVKSFSRKSVAAVERFDQKISNTFSKMNRFAQIGVGIGVMGMFAMAGQANLQYEDSLASVSAITGAVGEDLVKLEQLSKQTGKATYKSGAEVLKAYELIGSAKPELLQNAEALDAVTNSAITLSKASRMDLATSAEALTDVMNQFNLGAEKSTEVIDTLAAGAKYGAAAIPLIKDAILGFGATAKAANVNLQESVALVEVFASKGIKGAEAGTKLRNVLTKMSAVNALPPEALKQLDKFGVNTDIISDKTLPLMDRLKELSKISGDATALVKVFGLENKDAAQILLNNLDAYDDLVGKVGESGVAYDQAAKNSSTMAYWIKAVKDSFLNAVTATQSNNGALEAAKSILKFVADNMETVVGIGLGLIGMFATMKVITWGAQAATFAYNIAMGISAARTGAMSIAMKGNTVAIAAYNVATKAAAAGQWLLNAAMSENPIGLIIAAIVALIGVVYAIVKYYDQWGAAATMLLGPLGAIINIVMGIRKHWDSIVEAFQKDGIMAGIKKIGAVIMDSMLYPIEQFIGLISKIPGVGKMVAPALKFIEGMRASLDLEGSTGEGEKTPPEIIPSPEEQNGKMIQEKITNGKIDLNVNDPGGHVKDIKTSKDINMPVVGPTQGQR